VPLPVACLFAPPVTGHLLSSFIMFSPFVVLIVEERRYRIIISLLFPFT